MVLDTEKQVDESIASLLRECAKSDEEGLGGVLKVVTAFAEFMDLDNTMEVLNGLLYHDNERIALNSLSIFRHLHETGCINLQPIALSRIEDGEELVEPIDEEEKLFEDATITPELEEMQGDIMEEMEEEIPAELPSEDILEEDGVESLEIEEMEDIQEIDSIKDTQEINSIKDTQEIEEDALEDDNFIESVTPHEVEIGEEESRVKVIIENTEIENITPEAEITLEGEGEEKKDDFEFQAPGISTFIPIGDTGEEENIGEEIKGELGDDVVEIIAKGSPEIGIDDTPFGNAGESPLDAAAKLAPFGEIESKSPFEDLVEPAPIVDTASPFDNVDEVPPSPFNEGFEPEHERKKIKLPSISAIEDEAKGQWEETVDKIAKLKEKYINK